MEPGASLAMCVSTLSKLIAWPTTRNASFATSIALTHSRRVFLVLVRPSMCEGKRMPWSHTCVNASFTKCRTCRCLIRSLAPLKLNIPGLGCRLRCGCRPTTTTPSEHANSQSSSIDSQTGHKSPPLPSSPAYVAQKCLWGSYLKA